MSDEVEQGRGGEEVRVTLSMAGGGTVLSVRCFLTQGKSFSQSVVSVMIAQLALPTMQHSVTG